VPPHEWTSEVHGEVAASPSTPPAAGPASDGVPSAGLAPVGEADAHAPAADAAAPLRAHGVVDFRRTARRLRTGIVVVAVLIPAIWGVLVVAAAASLRTLAELAGLGLLALFVLEVVVVGGAAVRGLLAAGDRGDRLAGGDVSLVPPQVTRRRRR
jgi:hypothetical protein